MATILKARGRMTKDLVTPYEVGQEVVLVNPQFNDPDLVRRFPTGANGIIRKIFISNPRDGDETFAMLRIQVGDDSSLFGENEIAPVAASEAPLWLKKQLDALNGGAR